MAVIHSPTIPSYGKGLMAHPFQPIFLPTTTAKPDLDIYSTAGKLAFKRMASVPCCSLLDGVMVEADPPVTTWSFYPAPKTLKVCQGLCFPRPKNSSLILKRQGLPKERYVGELYFQAHRGTYTSQAKTKLGNRRSEFALRDAEFWGSLAHAFKDHAFSTEDLKSAWHKSTAQPISRHPAWFLHPSGI